MRDPLAWAGLCVVLGAAGWPWLEPGLDELLAGAWFMGALALVGRRWPASRLALLVGGVLLGAAACAVWPPNPDPPGDEHPVGRVVEVSGSEALADTDHGRLVLQFGAAPPPVGTLVAAWTSPARARARLPGESTPEAGWLRAGARPRRVRRHLVLGASAPEDPGARLDRARYAGLLRALAVGDRSAVPEDQARLLRRTGTSHLLAISGLHVGLVAGMLLFLARRLARPLALLPFTWPLRWLPPALALAGAVAYADLVGWPVSTRRAVWMVGAAAAAGALGRRPRPWSLLGLAAVLVVLVHPGQVTRPAFLLSFGAVAGMLLVSPRLLRLLPPDLPWGVRPVAALLTATVGALAGTLPTSAWLFQDLPPVAPLSNLVATPLVGGLVVPAALLGARVGGWPGALALGVADATLDLVLAALARLETEPLHPALAPVGGLLLAAALALRRRPLLAGALAVAALGGAAPQADLLVVSFLSVGQGDAALVAWPDGRRWLVDGGPQRSAVLHWLRREHIRHLDAAVLSHPHPDHLTGLAEVVAALDVDELWVPRPPGRDEASFLALWQLAWQRGVRVRLPGDELPRPRGPPGWSRAVPGAALAPTEVAVLHPLGGWRGRGGAAANEESLVLRLRYGATAFLFTGDVEAQAEAALVASDRLLRAQVVKVPHHGSHTSSSADLVARVGAAVAVITAGPDNAFGHPRPVTLARWRGARVLRTDRDGTVEIRSDGRQLQIRTWSPERGWRTKPLQND